VWEADPRRYAARLARSLAYLYPQLGKVEIAHVWSGVMGNPLHRMPQIGELSPGFWLASGFGGHGLNTTAMAGRLIARAITDGDGTWRLFLPFDLVWTGGWIGRSIVQVGYWMHRARERLDARLARKREQAHRRAEEMEALREQMEDEARAGQGAEVAASGDAPADAGRSEVAPPAPQSTVPQAVQTAEAPGERRRRNTTRRKKGAVTS
jgi:hypothetical protein